jgi:predicted ATP-grasp superfamily ATP-dependent carboligase
LGHSVTNGALSSQVERLLKAINYAGIMDIDYRFDRRDGQYKILDFNPRIGAQFRLFEDRNGIDVVKAMYYDLTGQPVCRSPQIDGRIFIVEPQDFLCSLYSLWRRKLTLGDWWRSLRGVREFAWFKWNDPAPCFILSIHMVIRGFVTGAQRIRPKQSSGIVTRNSK